MSATEKRIHELYQQVEALKPLGAYSEGQKLASGMVGVLLDLESRLSKLEKKVDKRRKESR